MTVVQHFDAELRRTPYDAFVDRIRARVGLAGFLMTPDAAFGFERGGTPDALAALGRRAGFEVVVVPPFTLEGRAVRSSEIRSAIAAGGLAEAAALLGRPVTLTGRLGADGRLVFEMPMALPPVARYAGRVGSRPVAITIDPDGAVSVAGAGETGRLTVECLDVEGRDDDGED